MDIQIISLDGKDAGSVTLKDDIFGLEPRADILHRMVRYQQLKAMSGTHDVKHRSEGVRTGKNWFLRWPNLPSRSKPAFCTQQPRRI